MPALQRTLAELTSIIRVRADQENGTFVSDSDIETMINGSAAALWDTILDYAGPDSFLSSTDVPTVAGTADYTLAATDIYRVVAVDISFSYGWDEIPSATLRQRHKYQNRSGWSAPSNTAYILTGRDADGLQKIRFLPTPTAVHTFRVIYLPVAFDVDSSTPLVSFSGWDEYVIADVCAKILEKEESAAAPFIKRRDERLAQIIYAAQQLSPHQDGVREAIDWGSCDEVITEPWNN